MPGLYAKEKRKSTRSVRIYLTGKTIPCQPSSHAEEESPTFDDPSPSRSVAPKGPVGASLWNVSRIGPHGRISARSLLASSESCCSSISSRRPRPRWHPPQRRFRRQCHRFPLSLSVL